MNYNLVNLATLLESTMTNAGIMDDYDEIIGDFVENDPIGAEQYHQQVMEGLQFINDILGKDYDTTTDGSGKAKNCSFHMIYLQSK